MKNHRRLCAHECARTCAHTRLCNLWGYFQNEALVCKWGFVKAVMSLKLMAVYGKDLVGNWLWGEFLLTESQCR